VCFFSARAFLISAIITAKIMCLGFLASYTNRVAPIIQISIERGGELLASNFLLIIYCFLFNFRFSIRYKVNIRFRFRFFKYPFYSRILVLLVLLYIKLKFRLLLSSGWYSS